MQPTARMCRSIWWAFVVAGVAAMVAAVAAAAGVAAITVTTGAWQLTAGVVLLLASVRAPGGLARAVPFVGVALGGIVLGLAGVLVPAHDLRISLIAIGVWGVLAGAGYRAVGRIIRAFGADDAGLGTIAWVSIGWGIVVSTLPAWALGNSTPLVVVSTVVTGAIAIVAAFRLRILPEEEPEVVSKREAQRRQRSAGGR